ncbi:Nse4 C-terminal-domain-containing protein [Xylaria sp. FL1777]|nr:Nse4 C-terminal-domain-containing protein [Xylaria sp. FL1777]
MPVIQSRASSQDEEIPFSSPITASQRSTLVMRDRSRDADGPSKRKRTLTNGAGPSTSRRRTHEPEFVTDDDVSDQYDPDQPLEERRRLQRGYRDLLRGLHENTEELANPKSLFLDETLARANQLSHHVKQTGEAIIDSKLLVAAADASYRRATRLANGNVAQGLDVDEFVSKCISYMRLGAVISGDNAPDFTSTRQQRRRLVRENADDSDGNAVSDDGDMMNWEHLGRFACLPAIRRPAVPCFLLGPLSVERKVRKLVKRSAPFRADNLRETRPEVLNAGDVQRAEKNDLTAICAKILRRLREVQDDAQTKVEAVFENYGDAEARKLMNKYGLRDTGGIDLLKFVVNPKSFGQTVENMFYVSFLIRDGAVQIEFDENGLPSLQPTTGQDPSSPKHDSQRHQAVLSIDMHMWRDIIDAFDIKDSIIEHRDEQNTQAPGARSWYS